MISSHYRSLLVAPAGNGQARTIITQPDQPNSVFFGKASKRQQQIEKTLSNFLRGADFASSVASTEYEAVIQRNVKALCADPAGFFSVFKSSEISTLIHKFLSIAMRLTSDDVNSISTDSATMMAKSFFTLCDQINESLFANVPSSDKSIAFWSGKAAESHIINEGKFLVDRQSQKLKFIIAMIGCLNKIRCHMNQVDLGDETDPRFLDNVNLLCSASCAYFASHAGPEVHIYLSSDSAGKSSGFLINNFFWNGEMPVLMHLYSKGQVQKMVVHMHDVSTDTWHEFDFFSKEIAAAPAFYHYEDDANKRSSVVTFKKALEIEHPRFAELYKQHLK